MEYKTMLKLTMVILGLLSTTPRPACGVASSSSSSSVKRSSASSSSASSKPSASSSMSSSYKSSSSVYSSSSSNSGWSSSSSSSSSSYHPRTTTAPIITTFNCYTCEGCWAYGWHGASSSVAYGCHSCYKYRDAKSYNTRRGCFYSELEQHNYMARFGVNDQYGCRNYTGKAGITEEVCLCHFGYCNSADVIGASRIQVVGWVITAILMMHVVNRF